MRRFKHRNRSIALLAVFLVLAAVFLYNPPASQATTQICCCLYIEHQPTDSCGLTEVGPGQGCEVRGAGEWVQREEQFCAAAPAPRGPVTFIPQVPIPGFTGGTVTSRTFGEYLRAFYVFFIGVVGILATIMVMYGGYRWIAAAGNASQISAAKTTVTNAIIGLVLAFTSFILLQLINPSLVRLADFQIIPVGRIVQDFGEEGDIPTKCPHQAELMQRYGRTEDEVRRELTSVTYRNIPLRKERTYSVHELVKPKFEAAFERIKNIDYDISSDPAGGAFFWREQRGNPCLSLHSFGIALDINPNRNPMCLKGSWCFDHPQTDIPAEVRQAFLDQGFKWGGNWKSKKDYMHFEIKD